MWIPTNERNDHLWKRIKNKVSQLESLRDLIASTLGAPKLNMLLYWSIMQGLKDPQYLAKGMKMPKTCTSSCHFVKLSDTRIWWITTLHTICMRRSIKERKYITKSTKEEWRKVLRSSVEHPCPFSSNLEV